MKVKVYLTIGYVGAIQEDVIEMDDESTDEEIEADVNDWAHNFIEFGWEKQ